MVLPAFCPGVALAQYGDSVGVYGMIERVEVDTIVVPATVRIWGVFTLHGDRRYIMGRGYLYYYAAADREAVLSEWANLRRYAGQRLIVGFGASSSAMGIIWPIDQKATGPTPYPAGSGFVDGMPWTNPMYEMMMQFPIPKTPGYGVSVSAGELTLVAQAPLSGRGNVMFDIFPVDSSGERRLTCSDLCQRSPPLPVMGTEVSWRLERPLKPGEYEWRVWGDELTAPAFNRFRVRSP